MHPKRIEASANQKKIVFWLVITTLVLLFLFTRLYNLLGIPIFNDEAIYLRWAEIFSAGFHHPLVSLVDGKQPSYIWATGVFLRIIDDPLLAGRVVSAVAGLLSAIGVYLLAKELFASSRVAFVACLVYILYPFSLLYDRMALYDSMLAMFAIWSLYMEVLLVRSRRIVMAIAAAVVIGGGLLTKSGAVFFVYLLPFSLLLFDFRARSRQRELAKWFGLAAITVAGAEAIYAILRLSPNYRYIASKNGEFTYTIGEWLQHPFAYVGSNTHTILGFMIGYSTIPLLLFVIAAFFVERSHFKEKLLLLSWSLLPLTALAFFGKLLYPRYILFMMMPLLLLAAYSILSVVKLAARFRMQRLAILLLLLAVPLLQKDYFIVTDFARASVPELDHYQYIEGFYGGVGVKQAVAILKQKSEHQKIYVGTQGTFGLMPDALQDYFYQNNNVIIQPYEGVGSEAPSQVIDATQLYPTYYIFTAPCPSCGSIGVAPKGWHVIELLRAKRLEKNSYLTLDQVLPE